MIKPQVDPGSEFASNHWDLPAPAGPLKMPIGMTQATSLNSQLPQCENIFALGTFE